MDLSKLPKMSDTRKAEAESRARSVEAEENQRLQEADAIGPGRIERAPAEGLGARRMVVVDSGPSAWISLVVGGLLILFMPRWWVWLSSRVFGTGFIAPAVTDEQGSPLAYEKSVFFLGDMAIGLFALALIVEGLVLIRAANIRGAVLFSLAIVAIATAFNLFFTLYMLSKGYALQVYPTLAVVFGVFMCVQQWQILRGPRRKYVLVEEV